MSSHFRLELVWRYFLAAACRSQLIIGYGVDLCSDRRNSTLHFVERDKS
ncbi:hypothetical protein [Stanieria cyanosphaera]|nr:hypothetical protein [Stanieria cyanosphaera]